MSARTHLKNLISRAVNKKFGVRPEFSVEVPENEEHGDYATNVALILGKEFKKSPLEIAKTLVGELSRDEFSEIKVAPPGFINFSISREELYKNLEAVLSARDLFDVVATKSLKINIEFISSNPTGPLTIGNGRGAFLGDALARILSFYGHKVTREYYINDARASNQVQELGKTILERGESYKGVYTEYNKPGFSLIFLWQDQNQSPCAYPETSLKRNSGRC